MTPMTPEQKKKLLIFAAIAACVVLIIGMVVLMKEPASPVSPNGPSGGSEGQPEQRDYWIVRFLSWDGSTLATYNLKPGELPSYQGKTPTRPQDEDYRYEFTGWDTEVTIATEDKDYTAQFQAIALLPPWDGSIATGFARGSGTQNDPYIIETAAQLAYLAKVCNEGNTAINHKDAYFKQEKDITLANNEWTPIGIGVDLTGKYDETYGFHGHYEALGYYIDGLTMTKAQRSYHTYFGLFGYNHGEIDHVTLKNVKISLGSVTTAESVGGICGSMRDTACIEYCHVEGELFGGESYTGGIVGSQYGARTSNLIRCTTSAKVSGKQYVGGIVGSTTAVVSSCRAEGSVSLSTSNNQTAVGGVIGYAFGAWVTGCEAAASVEHTLMRDQLSYVGGLIGYAGASTNISGCSSVGTVSTRDGRTLASQVQNTAITSHEVGGLIGRVYDRNEEATTVTDCYSTATVTTQGMGAGLISALSTEHGRVTRCYAAGLVSARSMASGFVNTISWEYTAIRDCVAFGNVTNPAFNKACGFHEHSYLSGTDFSEPRGIQNCHRAEYQLIRTAMASSGKVGAGTPQYASTLNSASFWTSTLNWDSTTWSFDALDVENGKYPTLK